jgi:hypothetical protein
MKEPDLFSVEFPAAALLPLGMYPNPEGVFSV